MEILLIILVVAITAAFILPSGGKKKPNKTPKQYTEEEFTNDLIDGVYDDIDEE